MNISKLKQSKFLTRGDVGTGLTVTIKGIDQQNVALESDPQEMRYVLHFQENPKPMVLNTTNGQAIASILKSEETDEWIGKQICLYDDPNVSFGGNRVGGIRVRASTLEPTTAKPAQATDKTRMWALNLLEAAPGQPNREIVQKFLISKGWIQEGQEPEAWSLTTVPMSKSSVAALAEMIQAYGDDVPF